MSVAESMSSQEIKTNDDNHSKGNSKGKMGRADLLSLSIGYVVGAGIITLVGQAIGVTGRSAWLAYLIAICLGFFINIPYLFLSKTARFSGGPYNLISSLSNEKLGGVYVTAFIAQCIGLSLYGVSFGVYVKSMWSGANETLVSILFVATIYVINLFGVSAMTKLQKTMTVILATALLMFICFGIPHVDPVVFDFNDSEFLTNGFDGLITAVFLLIFTATAYNMTINFGREAKDGKKDIPWVIVATVPIIMVLYVGVAIVNAGVFSVEQTANQPLTLVAKQILPTPLFYFFMIGGPLMALSTTLNSCMGGFSTPFIQAAKDGWFPKWIANKNSFGANYVILTILFCISLIPILLGFDIKTITNNIMLVQYILAILIYYSIWQMPKKFPEQWKKSKGYVSNGVFNLFMILAILVQGAIIFYAIRGLTIQIVIASLSVMVVCTIYALNRYKKGYVKMETGVWFD